MKFCLSSPILVCFAKPAVNEVLGIMLLGMILSELKGKTILGKFNFASNPYSEILKKRLSGFAKSFEAPKFPLKPISKVSAPLKTFFIPSDALPEIPKT